MTDAAIDPDEEAVHAVFEERWGALEYQGLLKQEQEYLAVWWLDGELQNGGLDQYFLNSAGDLAPEALAGLDAVGATVVKRLLVEAMALFGAGSYPTDQHARQERLLLLSPDGEALDRQTDEILATGEPFVALAARRLRGTYEEMGLMPGSRTTRA